MQGEPKPKQIHTKAVTGVQKSGGARENSGNKKNAPAGASTFRGADIYTSGLTKGMHGKAKGGHPTKRAQEMC